ncbi:MAG: hypothetical protein A2086_16430 [Spirochaetes bacterium GWD1_27_9]|nr:MAG: hypothetical protein A2Z98_03100 [Spirochaetes bacterium GWB1_27_13]OHD27805.1 MAG: hypothetical protein A2Y34_16585 [Spirochaetes bacterium GWC1_27_15]OHD33019.1 MAG: hypothetical protein A2086_16430 [Spirochaetes bacterium GWD1_27_9]
MKLKISIQFKIVLMFIIIISLLFVVVYNRIERIIANNFKQYINDRITISESIIDNYLKKILEIKSQNIKAFASISDLNQAIKNEEFLNLPFYLTKHIKEYDFDCVKLYNKDGDLLGEAGRNLVFDEGFLRRLMSKEIISEFTLIENKIYLISSYIFNDGNNILIGETILDDRVAEEVRRALVVDILIMRDNIIVAKSDFFAINKNIIDKNLIERTLKNQNFIINDEDHGLTIQYKPFKDSNNNIIGSTVSVLSTSILLDIKDESQKTVITIFFIGVCISIVLIFLLARTIIRPIKKLTLWANRIKEGDFKYYEKIKTHDEINDLSLVFGSMSKTILQYNEELENLVSQRTKELEVANNELRIVNEKNKKEFLLAQRIQLRLLPEEFPDNDKIKFFGLYQPMNEVGGDLYDVYKISENNFGVVILDVCGHGVPASLITTMAKVSFSVNSKNYSSTKDVVGHVNNEICTALQQSGDFFTACYATINTNKMTLDYTNAGHKDIIIIRKNDQIIRFENNNPFIGVLEDINYESGEFQLESGDRIILYTDGLTEARNKDEQLYEEENLVLSIQKNKNLSLKELIQKIYQDVIDFKQSNEMQDDIAIIGVEVS